MSIIVILGVTFADDPLRPQYHLMPPKNWLNDPNGPVYYNGYYHMFYQYYPNVVPADQKQWGHSYSTDMVHWIDLPIALLPDQSYDIIGVWTGSTTIVNGIPVIIYTGITNTHQQVQCQARPSNLSDPTLTNWTKSLLNPLITNPDGRDPSTAFQDNENNYYLIYGYGTQDLGGQAVLFTSQDFLNWTYLHPLHSNHYDTMWECPDIFKLLNYTVLKASLLGRDFWTIGYIDPIKLIFIPINHDLGEYTQLIDYGKFYASKTFYDPIHKQQIVVGWAAEDDNQAEQRGWQGLLTLPRAIFLSDDDLQIRTRPIDALTTLRDPNTHRQFQDVILGLETPFELIPNINGTQIEVLINWQFPVNQTLDFGLIVLSTPDGTQRTDIGISTLTNTSVMMNWDFPGFDYFSVPNVTQWFDCQSACDHDNKCHAWTYDTSKQINNNCFLKSGIPLKYASWFCVSGVKQQKINQQLVWIYINRVLSQRNPGASHSPIHGTIWMNSTMLNNQFLLELDIFIDHSVIEIFEPQNGRIAITGRVYPEEENAKNLGVYALRIPTIEDNIIIKTLDFWTLTAI
ncbi:unnamed protein product [Adineta steineri]|uniref:Apple domain-containing protein n=1 Tax=Adineta steineri TaxID=433720 RepID=A0A816CDH6_9BILA|nr:unnamed protein product [Adineta steineri]CAF1620151.1 unnamed protein product [Adineta steineri]